MKIKFPALDKVVSKSKALPKDNIRQYIFVHNGYAMTFDKPVFIVNLYEYVKTECSIDDDEELQHLRDIISFLEGRAIPSAAWKELTKLIDVDFDGDDITINKVDHKSILVLEENNIGIQYFVAEIRKYIKLLEAPSVNEPLQAYYGTTLDLMSSVFKKEIASDSVTLTKCQGTSTVKYQLSNKNYIFGLLNIDQSNVEEIKSMTSELDISNLVTDLRIGLSNIKFPDIIKEEKEVAQPKEEVHHPFQMNDDSDELFKD